MSTPFYHCDAKCEDCPYLHVRVVVYGQKVWRDFHVFHQKQFQSG